MVVLIGVVCGQLLLGKVTNVGIIAGEGVIKRAEVDYSAFADGYATQGMQQWCWAASISNIFAYYGHPVSQDRIVTAVYGRVVNLPAMSGAMIARQVNRVWIDDDGRRFRARLTAAYDADAGVVAITNDYMIRELCRDRPLIICNRSHCMVLTVVDYTQIRLVAAGVFDPWPSSGPRGLSAPEMTTVHEGGQLRFLAALTVTDLH